MSWKTGARSQEPGARSQNPFSGGRRGDRAGFWRRRGLSLVEVMISLAITSMLLTAVGAAFTASTSAIGVNDRFFRATQSARVSMNRLMSEVRTGEYISVSSDRLRLLEEDPDTGAIVERTYRYFPPVGTQPGELRLFIDEDPNHPGYVLASNVAHMTFEHERQDINNDGLEFVVRVSITMTVEVEDSRVRLSGSAVPRRNLRY